MNIKNIPSAWKTEGHKDSYRNLIFLGRRYAYIPEGYLLSSAVLLSNLSTKCFGCQGLFEKLLSRRILSASKPLTVWIPATLAVRN